MAKGKRRHEPYPLILLDHSVSCGFDDSVWNCGIEKVGQNNKPLRYGSGHHQGG
jgi:hypothetical protein